MEKIYKMKNNILIKGYGLPAFIYNDFYYCALIKVYEDGLIDCWGEVDFKGFVQKVKDGFIVTQLPDNGIVERHHSFRGDVKNLNTYIEEAEFIKEVADVLNLLQNKQTSSQKCKEAYNAYIDKPSEFKKQILKESYNNVPKHLKNYILSSMSAQDGPITYILFGKKNISGDAW